MNALQLHVPMVELVLMRLILIRVYVLMAIPDQTVQQVNILFIIYLAILLSDGAEKWADLIFFLWILMQNGFVILVLVKFCYHRNIVTSKRRYKVVILHHQNFLRHRKVTDSTFIRCRMISSLKIYTRLKYFLSLLCHRNFNFIKQNWDLSYST